MICWRIGFFLFPSPACTRHTLSHTHAIIKHKQKKPRQPSGIARRIYEKFKLPMCVRKLKQVSLRLMAPMNIICLCVNVNTHLIFYLWFSTSFCKCICTWGDAFTQNKNGNMNDSLFKCVFRFFLFFRWQKKRWKSFVNLISVGVSIFIFGSSWIDALRFHIQRHQLIWLNAFS